MQILGTKSTRHDSGYESSSTRLTLTLTEAEQTAAYFDSILELGNRRTKRSARHLEQRRNRRP